jgi:hypothetical protein
MDPAIGYIGSGGGGGVPSSTVVTETSYAQAPAAGAASTFSRGDHTHGTPPAVPTSGAFPLSAYGFVAASGPLEAFTSVSTFDGKTMFVALAYVPAGVAIARVGTVFKNIGTFSPAQGPQRVAVYEQNGTLAGSSVDDQTLWSVQGWRFGTLAVPVPAQAAGRLVYAAILTNGYANSNIAYNVTNYSDVVNTGLTALHRVMFSNAFTDLPASINPATFGTVTNFLPLIALA